MTSNRRYQLEKLEADLSERFRFTSKRIEASALNEDADDDIAFYTDRLSRINKVLEKIKARGSFLVDCNVEIE